MIKFRPKKEHRWKERINRVKSEDKELTDSEQEWKPKTEEKFWQEEEQKVEKD